MSGGGGPTGKEKKWGGGRGGDLTMGPRGWSPIPAMPSSPPKCSISSEALPAAPAPHREIRTLPLARAPSDFDAARRRFYSRNCAILSAGENPPVIRPAGPFERCAPASPRRLGAAQQRTAES